MANNRQISAEDIHTLYEAEEMVALKSYPPFVRLRSMLDAVVAESHVAMEKNTDRTKAFDLQMAWRERKVFLDFIDSYISVIAAKRQDTVRELLANLGLDPERIEQHINMSTQGIAFIQSHIGGQK